MWKRTRQKYGSTPVPETPYQKAAQVWDERMGSALTRGRNWRMMAFSAMGLSFALAGGLIWQSAQATITPYIVEVTESGAVKTVGQVNGGFQPSDAHIANQLARFITNVRSVSIDPVVLRQNWLEGYAFATDQAALTLNTYANANDPFTNIGQRSVTVDIASIVRSSEDSFEIRWRETEFQRGARTASDTYTASLSIILNTPTDPETLHRNPLGLYVHGLNWSKDLTTQE